MTDTTKPNGIASTEIRVYDPFTLIEQYRESLNTPFEGKVITVQGFYLDRKGKKYNDKSFYDSLLDKKTQTNITLQLNEEIKTLLNDGGYYQIQGYINKRKNSRDDSAIQIVFYVLNIEKEEKDVQLISQKDYDVIKHRFDKGLFNVESYLLEKLYQDKKPYIVIITGHESIVLSDFYSELDSPDSYQIETKKVNLSSQTEILEYLEQIENPNIDLLAFMRGGGSGISLFDEKDLCEKVLNTNFPFVTAIGHEIDQPLLDKISDKSFATPTAFGVFLEKLVRKDEERKIEVDELHEKIQNIYELKDRETAYLEREHHTNIQEKEQQLDTKEKQLNKFKIVIAVMGFIVLILFYFFVI